MHVFHDSSSTLVTAVFGFFGLFHAHQHSPGNGNVAVDEAIWQSFNASVGGRLFRSTATSGPCARTAPMLQNVTFASSSAAERQWDTCREFGANGGNHAFYVDVRSAQDVAEAMRFVQETHVPLVIDHLQTEFCSSPAHNSLALWTRHMNQVEHLPNFTPSQCTSPPTSAISISAGASIGRIYTYADKLNLTVVGASIPSLVGAGGEFLSDATSVLAPTFGSALDNVLEFEVVTPDGVIRTVNRYAEKDLWFALRGGGSTFGIVTRTIVKAHPKIHLYTLSAFLEPSEPMSKRILTVTSYYAVEWAKAGWGGFIGPSGIFLTNPGKLSETEALESMKPLTILLDLMGEDVRDKTFTRHESFAEYMKFFALRTIVPPFEYAVSSRLIPSTVFASPHGKADVNKAIITASKYVETWTISLSLPYGFNPTEDNAFTPAMYDSPWLVYFTESLAPGMSKADRLLKHSALAKATNFLRYITPGSGTYYAQADLSEVEHEYAFWGENYAKLLEVKEKYDPDHVLKGWQSVGWKGPLSDLRFSCYTPAKLQRVRCDRWCR